MFLASRYRVLDTALFFRGIFVGLGLLFTLGGYRKNFFEWQATLNDVKPGLKISAHTVDAAG